jgi:hypothetical protein
MEKIMNQFNHLHTTVNLGTQPQGVTQFSSKPENKPPVESSFSIEVIFFESVDPASLGF